ncbi:hypothetical protein FQN54_007428 [Arachnomyces sp. PD_36]|nr:hypothetical protein FQN54_007428 [Arachnomyces sp. PD_36]
MDAFWAAPPVTRTLTLATGVLSALVHGKLLPGYWVIFYLPRIFKLPPELWRIPSSFLLTGGGFSLIMDLYFMYTYGSKLETQSARFSAPGDFFTYLIFVATTIMLTAGYLGGMVFTSALILALVYTFAQENRGRKVTFFVVQIPVEFLPFAMLGMTLVMGSWEGALLESMGIVAAHLYDFLTRIYPAFGGGRNYITTPGFVRRWFARGQPRQTTRPHGTAFRANQPTTQGGESSRGWSSGFGNSWGGRGAGRRLGGD